jgi:calcineurin-like phosphoesterase family protein
MLEIINSKVNRNDELYILGDYCFGSRSDLSVARMKIKCSRVWLIYGNHDLSESACKEVFGDKFRITYMAKINETPVWLSHYPHLAWPQSHYGYFHLFGHMHRQRSDYWDGIFPEMRALDVCPESYKHMFGEWGIFSEDQIYEFMIKRKGHDDVSYYRERLGEL